MTLTEKILARAAGRASVSPGDYLEVTPIPVTVINPSSMEGRVTQTMDWGKPLAFPDNVYIVDGHLGASASNGAAHGREFARYWMNKMGVPGENFLRLGRSGIENMITVEKCWVRPGDCYFQGVNGHISTAGALGAFTSALGYETASFLIRGVTWVKVPRTLRVDVVGTPGPGVLPRDISEALLQEIGPTGSVGCVIEWGGEYIDSLPMDGRFAICSQAMTTGGWTSIVNPDEITLDYVRGRTDEPFEPLVSDPDAVYFKTVTLDASAIEPLVVIPPSRYDIRAVGEVSGIKVSKGFIGSDAGGWISDLRIAADVLRGKQLPYDVVLNITPGTVEILKQSLNEGLLEVFIDAKCVIPTPNEGMEGGKNTPLEKDDVCIATSQSNYPGRMGAYTAEIYLANAATVAASCLAGEIADPRPYLA